MDIQKTYKGLPVFRAKVNPEPLDETGMYCISLVEFPAVERDFVAFGRDAKPMTYSVQDEEKRQIFGVIMLCDTLIYRNDYGFEYWVEYSREDIEAMAEKYLRLGKQNNVDTDHNLHLEDGIYLNQMFIKDSTKGIVPKGFEDVSDGSLFGQFHVESDDLWVRIKNGEWKGFSLYGLFESVPVNIDEYNNKKKDNIKMSKFEKIKALLAKALQAFGQVTTDKGILSWDGDEDLKAGDTVQIYDVENDSYSKPEDGSYSTSEGIEIVVENGVVKEVIDHSLDATRENVGNTTEGKDNEVAPEVIEAEDATNEDVDKDNAPEEEPKVDNPDGTTEDVTKAVEELRKEVNELFAKFDELVRRVDELEKKPLAEPAAEEFKRKYKTTQAEGFGRLSEIMNATRK